MSHRRPHNVFGSSGVSKLAAARGISKDNPLSTLGDMPGLGDVTAEEFYEAMDWLGASGSLLRMGVWRGITVRIGPYYPRGFYINWSGFKSF